MTSRLLVLTNESELGVGAPGVHDVLLQLDQEGETSLVAVDSWRPQPGETKLEASRRVRLHLADVNYDFLFVVSPRGGILEKSLAESLDTLVGNRTVIIWEGDPIAMWKIDSELRCWLKAATFVFSQYGSPQPEMLLSIGVRMIYHLPATYCHVQFKDAEIHEPALTSAFEAVMVASNNRRRSLISAVPGAGSRRLVARSLRRDLGGNFLLHGTNWPRKWNVRSVPFRGQIEAIRLGAVSVNSDNTPGWADSSSNRLPISLLAGRPHITSSHRGMLWAPDPSVGLHMSPTPASLVATVHELLGGDRFLLAKSGLKAREWALGRVSHRQSIRYMLQTAEVIRQSGLPRDPWLLLPGPWTQHKNTQK